jgi:N-acetylmuramoyl-L-alanine amidase
MFGELAGPNSGLDSGSLHGRTICLDPGHPSENGAGTRGRRITEVRACWLVALAAKPLLSAHGARVVLTKQSESERVTNKRRAEIANEARADLLVRLHCDAQGGSGTSTYYPDRPGATSRGVRGPSPVVIAASARAARRFHPAMMAELRGRMRDRGLLTDRHTLIGGKQGALTGSIFSRVPVLLVEMAVLTNARDDAFMATATGQQQMARAITAGIVAALRS